MEEGTPSCEAQCATSAQIGFNATFPVTLLSWVMSAELISGRVTDNARAKRLI